jgi:hypothetical protein
MTLAILFTGGFDRGLSAIQNRKHLAEISSSPTITKVVDEFKLFTGIDDLAYIYAGVSIHVI